MHVDGIVREWHDAEGRGIIDSELAPGGCWVHWSHIDLPGYRTLTAGQKVDLEFEAVRQDGHDYCAQKVKPI